MFAAALLPLGELPVHRGTVQRLPARPRLAHNLGQQRRQVPAAAARRERAVPPNRAHQASRGSSSRQRREPFDAELLTLFGIPTAVLVIAFACNDPSSLVVTPLALMLPGPRDVLLALASDMLRGVGRAARFVSTDEGDLTARAAEADVQQARWHARARRAAAATQQQRRQPAWDRATPPPPPPPPPVVDVEYTVHPPPAQPTAQAAPAAAPHGHWPRGQHPSPPYQHPGYHTAPPPPPQQQRDSYEPTRQQQQQQQQPAERSAPAAGWPASSAERRGPRQPQQQAAQPQQARGADAGEPPAMPRRRLQRGGSPAAAAAAPASVKPAAVAPHRRRRQAPAVQAFGAAEQRGRDATPLLLRPLFALVPFLRYWGGFL